jgi:hypothetical protein
MIETNVTASQPESQPRSPSPISSSQQPADLSETLHRASTAGCPVMRPSTKLFGRDETPQATALRKHKLALLPLAGSGRRCDFKRVELQFKLMPELRAL